MFDWLFGKGRDAYEKEQRQALDNAYTDKFVTDYVSQQMGGMRDKFKGTIDDNQWNDAMDNIKSIAQRNSDTYNDTQKQFDETMKKQRHNYFGDGLLGSILNPIAQTGTAALDLATGNYKDRDVMSDLGAAGQTLLSALPAVGGAAKALNMGKVASGLDKVNKALYTIPGSMATGAAFGAAVPAAMKYGGKALRNRGSKVVQNSLAGAGVGADDMASIMSKMSNKALYQEALRSLVPKSTFGKLALGGGALYGGSRLLGGGQPQPQTIDDYYAMQQGGY